MSNTYAINTTRGQEFAVDTDLRALGLHPWTPRQLVSKWVKDKGEFVWYDKPYVSKLVFCTFPAIYWPDVVKLKHVVGKPLALRREDIVGVPACTITRKDGSTIERPAWHGLQGFKAAITNEYADMQRRKDNSEYQCLFVPGQALEILSGAFEGFSAEFKGMVKASVGQEIELNVGVDIFGRDTKVTLTPDMVSAA